MTMPELTTEDCAYLLCTLTLKRSCFAQYSCQLEESFAFCKEDRDSYDADIARVWADTK